MSCLPLTGAVRSASHAAAYQDSRTDRSFPHCRLPYHQTRLSSKTCPQDLDATVQQEKEVRFLREEDESPIWLPVSIDKDPFDYVRDESAIEQHRDFELIHKAAVEHVEQ